MRKTYQIGSKVNKLDYFCVTPKNGSTDISWVCTSQVSPNPGPFDMEYTIDKTTWYTYTLGDTITSSSPVYFRGNNRRLWRQEADEYDGIALSVNNTVDLSGQLGSLAHKHATTQKKPLDIKFKGNTYIRSIKDLIVDLNVGRVVIDSPYDWGNFSCKEMFANCTNLIDTPKFNLTINDVVNQTTGKLIFKTNIGSLYESMFDGCSNLTTIYSFPPIYGKNCYKKMFKDCSSLTTTPASFISDAMEPNACLYMFQSCDSLTTAPALPSTTLAEYCYQAMFYNCNSLVNAPALPATTLAEGCYSHMFIGCYSLRVLPALSATVLPSKCYQYMFANLHLDQIASNRYIFMGTLKSSSVTGYNNEFTITATSAESDSLSYMFGASTEGNPYSNSGYSNFSANYGFVDTPTINTTYYLWNSISQQ